MRNIRATNTGGHLRKIERPRATPGPLAPVTPCKQRMGSPPAQRKDRTLTFIDAIRATFRRLHDSTRTEEAHLGRTRDNLKVQLAQVKHRHDAENAADRGEVGLL